MTRRDRVRESLIGWRLASRLAVPRSRKGLAEALVTVLAVALVIAAFGWSWGLGAQLSERQAVLERRSPVWVEGEAGSLVSLDTYVTLSGELTVYRLGPNVGGVDLPGSMAWPEPGSVILSPGARAARSSDQYVDALTRGEQAGTVPDLVLREPAEMVAFVGEDTADAAGPGYRTVSGFGAPSVTGFVEDVTPAQARGWGLVLTVVLGAGALSTLAAAGRLGGAARERRLAVLDLMGCSSPTIRGAMMITAAVQALAGVAVGLAVAVFLTAVGWGPHLLGVRYWPVRVGSVLPQLLILGAVVVALMAVWGAALPGTGALGTRRRAPEGRPSYVRLVPLGVGSVWLASVAAVTVRTRETGPGWTEALLYLFVGAVCLVGLGLVWASPVLVRAAAPLVSRAGADGLVVASRAVHFVRGTARIGGGLCVLILSGAVCLGLFAAVMGPERGSGRGEVAVVLPGLSVSPRSEVSRALAAAMSSPNLAGATALRGSGELEDIAGLGDLRLGDQEYRVLMAGPGATEIAAMTVSANGQPTVAAPLTFNAAGEHVRLLLAGSVVVGAGGCVAFIVIALVLAMVTLQQQHVHADQALLHLGMSRFRLGRLRAAEVSVAGLPAPLLAALAGMAAAPLIETANGESAGSGPWSYVWLLAVPVAASLLLAGVAWLTVPSADRIEVRRD